MLSPMNVTHDTLDELVSRLAAPIGAPELHGLVTGLVAAGGSNDASLRERFGNWLDADPGDADMKVLEGLLSETREALWTHSDLDLRLLIPGDEIPIDVRGAAVFEWCDGFLSGFGGTVGNTNLSPEVSEILQDFAEIARIEDPLGEDEDNEHDLMQVIEYVRMSVAIVFHEHGDPDRHRRSSET